MNAAIDFGLDVFHGDRLPHLSTGEKALRVTARHFEVWERVRGSHIATHYIRRGQLESRLPEITSRKVTRFGPCLTYTSAFASQRKES